MNLIIDAKSINPYNNCNLRKIIYHQYLPMLIGIFNQMGARFDRLRCEVCQNLILSPMNTGLLRYAVATALTVHGIETIAKCDSIIDAVDWFVATALTVHGIETIKYPDYTTRDEKLQQHLPFTVLKLSHEIERLFFCISQLVATALTVHGIETQLELRV